MTGKNVSVLYLEGESELITQGLSDVEQEEAEELFKSGERDPGRIRGEIGAF